MKIAGKFPCGAAKVSVLFAAAVSLAGCDGLVAKANTFKMPVARAYDKLVAANIKPSGRGPFGRLQIETTGKKNETVEWGIKGSRFGYLCNATLKPLDAEQTRVDVSCKDFGDGAGAGITATLIRNAVIEFVDATLKDRPYDPKKAEDGYTAALWPKDVIDHGTLGTAAGKALAMDRQMAEDLQQMRNSTGKR